jgi:drug/metabolite transporter (DMT)-like permease
MVDSRNYCCYYRKRGYFSVLLWIENVKAIVATIMELFFPISAIIFDYVFNDHLLSPVQWIAAAIMIFAIINLNADNSRALKKSNKENGD